MASIHPFKALRPTEKTAGLVAALPYDVFNREEAKKEVEGKPFSFLRVDRAETTLPDTVSTYDPAVYKKAKENLEELKKNNILIEDNKEVFYLYELKMGEHIQTGLVATCDVDDYLNGVIKEHEATRKDKEKDRINHVSTLNAHTGPIYLTYKHEDGITDYIDSLKQEEPLFSFESEDGIKHSVWRVNEKEKIENLKDFFRPIESFYVADGHHRCVSAVKVAQKRRQQGESGDFEHFLSVIFPDNELKILDYNRIVRDLNGLTPEEFLGNLSKNYIIEESTNSVKPVKKSQFGLYLDGKWYRLDYKDDLPDDPVKSLDVSLLYDTILNPVLGIGDPRTDGRIDFVGGNRGLSELEDRVDNGMAVAFSLYPTALSELITVADKGELMPPKSTWFEPKLRSGLFIHEF